jgi:RNA polymerase sigma-70 factor (ECF subfamily)
VDPRATRYLVRQAGNGDREALDQLFARALPRLRALLAVKAGPALRQRAELDDLIQEAYAEALRQFANYTWQGDDSFFRWLATIAVHRLQNLARVERAGKRDPRREVPMVGPETAARQGGVSDAADPAPGPRTLTVGAEAGDVVRSAIARMSEADREVIVLARLEGLPLQEVAQRIGRTRNATALLLSRALRKLKDLLGEAAP